MGFGYSARKKKSQQQSEDLEAEVIIHAWKEPAFKQKLLSNPRETLLGLGVEIPENVRCEIVEEKGETWTFVLPSCPKDISKLKEDELRELAISETHHLHRMDAESEEGLWELFSHRYWPSHHEEE